MNNINPADRARFARALRREIASVKERRLARLDLHDALADYGDLLRAQFLRDCEQLHRLRRAANALEFVPTSDTGGVA